MGLYCCKQMIELNQTGGKEISFLLKNLNY